MKTTPTETDREAGRVFVPLPAMCVMWTATSKRWERVADGTAHTGHPFAIDADDPATAGQMLAQVEAMRPRQAVSIVDRLRSLPGEDERRFAVMVEYDGAQTVATGPTRGAALVAAKRALAEAPK